VDFYRFGDIAGVSVWLCCPGTLCVSSQTFESLSPNLLQQEIAQVCHGHFDVRYYSLINGALPLLPSVISHGTPPRKTLVE